MPQDERQSKTADGARKMESKDGEEVNPNSAVVLDGQRMGESVKGTLSIHGREIATPSFVLEIASLEDFETMIRNCHLLKEPHIVAVGAYHWVQLTQSIPTIVDDELSTKSRNLASMNHIVTYEAPELYRYLMPRKLLTHALRGDSNKAKKFWKLAMVDDSKEEALALLPAFEGEFVRNQWDLLRWQHYSYMERLEAKSLEDVKVKPERPEDSPDPESAWSSVSESYIDHMTKGLLECQGMNTSSSFVPGIRTLKAGSEKYVRNQVKKSNRASAFIWRNVLDGPAFPGGRPWFHLSLDSSIFTKNGDVDTGPDDVLTILDASLDPSAHCGICVTMTGWQKAWQVGKPRNRLETFFTELSDVAFTRRMPTYGARSKWIGLDLVDRGLTFAGTLLNGNEMISRSSGWIDSSTEKAFGKVPIYSYCEEATLSQLFETNSEWGKFQKPIELHSFDGIESKCDPALQYDAVRFRREFAKPRRIATHTQEVREIREALDNGVFRPGREYLKKSSLWNGVPQ